MCNVKGCRSKAVAKGLCAKHYMRLRRTGDPQEVRRAGRKPSTDLMSLFMRKNVPEWSDRTHARYQQAMVLMSDWNQKSREEVLKTAIRPNGSVNVSRLLTLVRMVRMGRMSDSVR